MEVSLMEAAELGADVFTGAGAGEASFRSVDRGRFPRMVAGDHLANRLPPLHKAIRGTATANRRYDEDPDKMSAMTRRHPDRAGGSRLAGRRGIDKDGYAFKRHK
jgi:hypothetical protein